jgi:hypothetical protein
LNRDYYVFFASKKTIGVKVVNLMTVMSFGLLQLK